MNTRNTKRRFDSDSESDSDYVPPLKVPKKSSEEASEEASEDSFEELENFSDNSGEKDDIFWIYELDLSDDISKDTHKDTHRLIGTSIDIPDNKILVISNLCVMCDDSRKCHITVSMIRNDDDYPINIVSGLYKSLNTNLNIRLCSKTKNLLFQAEGILFNHVTLTGYFIDA